MTSAGALGVLRRAGIRAERADEYLRVSVPPSSAVRISRTLGEQGHWVRELRPEEHTLEDLFLAMTEDAAAVDHARLEEVDV